jgi:hypothetical protein
VAKTTTKRALRSIEALPPSDEPWERQPSETAAAFAAFRRYRDMDAEYRSVRKLVQTYPVKDRTAAKLRHLQTWSAAHHWVARALAWDEYRDRDARRTQIEEIRTMAREHADAASRLVRKGLEALEKLKIEDMTPGEVVKFVVDGAKLERLARGEPESIVDVPSKAPTGQQSVRELLSSDPELAKQAAIFSSQVLRVQSEQEEGEA